VRSPYPAKKFVPLPTKQIELVQNFAAQAVIAIENTRLLNELRESLQEQTATSEVLRVISSSPGDLQPVFEAMLEKAVRICDAKFGNIYRWDGELLHLLAAHNTPQQLAETRKRLPFRPRGYIERMVAACAWRRRSHPTSAIHSRPRRSIPRGRGLRA
jgi:hypothetical protein